MSTPEEIHQQMADGYAKQRQQRPEHWKTQAEIDETRRPRHFQVRLHDDLANKLRHYMDSRDLNANQALTIIVSKFFNG